MIEVKNLIVGMDNNIIINDVSLTIPDNKTTLLLGHSGSGKSVLMKTVEALFKPLKGSVAIDGVDVFSMNKKELQKIRTKLSMLFQHAALFDSMTVFQNIALPLVEHKQLSMSEIKAKVAEKLSIVGLTGIESKMPSELSGGMKKRVALARAIIMEPKYIIYDEPTTGLDPKIASDIIDLIIKLRQDLHITSIVITHDLECIKRVGEYVVVIQDGEKKFEGEYEEFLETDDDILNQFKAF